MTTIPTPADFFNRPGTRQDGADHPGRRRHHRPPGLDHIASPLDLACLVLRRRHRLPPRLAALVAELAAIGQGVTP